MNQSNDETSASNKSINLEQVRTLKANPKPRAAVFVNSRLLQTAES